MGPPDELTEKVASALSGAAPAAARTATAVAPEDPSELIGEVLDVINDAKTGGLAGFVKQFQDRGLGDIVSGWIGTGHNPPISPAQVQAALGSQQLGLLAGKTGLSLPDLAAKLAIILPIIVDDLTPDGLVPPAGSPLNAALDWLD